MSHVRAELRPSKRGIARSARMYVSCTRSATSSPRPRYAQNLQTWIWVSPTNAASATRSPAIADRRSWSSSGTSTVADPTRDREPGARQRRLVRYELPRDTRSVLCRPRRGGARASRAPSSTGTSGRANRAASSSPRVEMPDLMPRIARAADEETCVRSFLSSPVRVALAGIALAQLALAVPTLLFGTDEGAPVHIAHEVGAWDLALAVGFLFAAWRPLRAVGMLPFVAALSAGLAYHRGRRHREREDPGRSSSSRTCSSSSAPCCSGCSRRPARGAC